jgi:hypothetical protein
VVERQALGQVCGGLWHWDRLVGGRVAMEEVCGAEWHWDRFMVDRVALGQVCGGHSGTGTGLWWTEWHWDRFVVDTVALGQVGGGQKRKRHWDRFVVDRATPGTGSSPSTSDFPCQYRSNNAAYSSLSTRYSYQKGKRAKLGNFLKARLFR